MIGPKFYYLVLIETVVLAVLFIICVKLIVDERKKKLIIENLNLYNKTLTKMYDGIRSLKHDYINFIQCLKGYTSCNDMTGVKLMVDSVYNESKNICNMEFLSPEIINNPGVYNLLINKYNDANSKNVLMNIEVSINFEDLNIDSYTLCRILGILVDNSIEAAVNCKKKVVNIRFIQENGYKALIVENTYNEEELDMSRLFEKGYSTKTGKEEHGLGLWKVRQIVDSSKNLKLNTRKSYLFSQELKIKDRSKKELLKAL